MIAKNDNDTNCNQQETEDKTIPHQKVLKLLSYSNRITKDKYLKLLSYSNNYGKGELTHHKKEIIWNSISEQDPKTKKRYLNRKEFIQCIPWYLGCRIILYKVKLIIIFLL